MTQPNSADRSTNGPVRDLGQFVALARRTPGGLRVGTTGNGSSAHVSLELLRRLSVSAA